MSQDSITLAKSKDFALRIINLYNFLIKEKREQVMSKQLLRSGTSIGANLSEAIFAISKKDFKSKVYIALKECSESKYWIELLYKSKYISEDQYNSINNDCTEILKLLITTTKSLFIPQDEDSFD